jgi:hypothetical protein
MYCIAAKAAIHFWGFIIIMPILLIASTLVSIINFWPLGKNTDRFSKTLLIYGCIYYLYLSNHIVAKLFNPSKYFCPIKQTLEKAKDKYD